MDIYIALISLLILLAILWGITLFKNRKRQAFKD